MPVEVLQKMLCRWPGKIPDNASEEQDQERLIPLAAGRGFLTPFEIRSIESNHADRPKMSQLLMALEEGRRRDIDGKIGDGLPVRKCFQYPAGLSTAATPQLDH